MGEEIKRPPAGRGRPQDIAEGGGAERSGGKGASLRRSGAKQPTRNFQKSCFVFHGQPSSSISVENQ
jgi:hypothetical protein